MSYQDWCIHFNRTYIAKVFPETWENYSIMSKWNGKSNGGVCPQKMKWETEIPEYLQLDTDEKWFNNPQFRIKVTKETKVYLSLMQEDEKISEQKYIQCNFMVVVNKVKGIRIWERPLQSDVVIEANANGE